MKNIIIFATVFLTTTTAGFFGTNILVPREAHAEVLNEDHADDASEASEEHEDKSASEGDMDPVVVDMKSAYAPIYGADKVTYVYVKFGLTVDTKVAQDFLLSDNGASLANDTLALLLSKAAEDGEFDSDTMNLPKLQKHMVSELNKKLTPYLSDSDDIVRDVVFQNIAKKDIERH